MNKKQKSVFITGATGSVGQALISAFSSKGYRVSFQYNSKKSAALKLAKDFNAIPFQIDFGNNFDLPNEPFDIVINNAGINIANELTHKIQERDWEMTIKINLLAPSLIAKKYIPQMMRNKWGRIINISSIYGLRGVSWNLPYNVSKHGLSGLTKTIAKEYATYRITSNEICPAQIESEMMKKIAAKDSAELGISVKKYFKEEIISKIPANRMAQPKEIASLAVFLASDEAGFINGASIVVDGGLIA